ncbi:MAG: DUF5060 domain-containing protein, partial [Candidatus Sulfotelmatobacter sp.]
MRGRILGTFLVLLAVAAQLTSASQSTQAQTWMFERTFSSQKGYADPFNDVDVDVVFTRGGESWRVPTFWRGGNKWTVRFAPPTA